MARSFAPILRANASAPLDIATIDGNFSGISGIANAAGRPFLVASQAAMLSIADTPNQGDTAWRTDEKKLYTYIGGGAGNIANWETTASSSGSSRLFAATADATSSNTASPATIVGAGNGSMTLASSVWAVGKSFRITAGGECSNNTAGLSLEVSLFLGATKILMLQTLTQPSFVGASATWRADMEFTCRTVSATGALQCAGMLNFHNGSDAWTGRANVQGSGSVDLTASQVLDVRAGWGAASVSNTVTGSVIILESLG